MKAANKQYVFIVLYAFASSFEAVNKILNLKSYSVKASESAKNERFFSSSYLQYHRKFRLSE